MRRNNYSGRLIAMGMHQDDAPPEDFDPDDFTMPSKPAMKPIKRTKAARYENKPMATETATDVMLAFWFSQKDVTIQKQANGAGFDAIIPMEWVMGRPEIRDELAKLRR